MGSTPPAGSICEWCSNPLSGYQKRFCSLSCSVRNQSASRAVPFKYCQRCEKSFAAGGERARNKYCSRSCAASANNQTFPKRKPGKRVPCLVCKTLVPSRVNRSGLCSPSCKDAYRVDQWLEGNKTYDYVATFMRRWLTSKEGEQCWTCGWNTFHPDGRSILQVEHINGNSTDNSSENLALLCPNCHALTPTFGARNMGNGRKNRRESYNRH